MRTLKDEKSGFVVAFLQPLSMEQVDIALRKRN